VRIELQGRVTDADTAWRRLGDTDFLNREAGAGRVEMSLAPSPGGASRIVGKMSGPLGLPLQFEETVNGWVRHRWFRQERAFQRSPIAESKFELTLAPAAGGVVPQIVLELEPAARVFAPVLAARADAYRTKWQAVLDGLPQPGTDRPALQRTLDAHTQGALARWGKTADRPIVEAITDLLRHDRDTDLRQLRAFSIADRFGLDRQETLVSMMRAVPAGVLELYWSVRCRRCRGEVASTHTLSDLADHAECPSCRVSFATDLGETVELLFAPHPAVAPRVAEKFCTLYPAGAPAVHATLPLEPGAEVDVAVDLAEGASFAFGPGGEAADLQVDVSAGGESSLRWEPGSSGARRVAPGSVGLSARNATAHRQRVILADASSDRQIAPASLVSMMPEFRREFGVQVLAPNVRIGTRSVALLFTDLSGSTALYRQIGDARAYALVRDHFDLLRGLVEQHGGAVVKTVGDAVMASFHTASAALMAALAMRAAFDGWIAAQGVDPVPRLNVGIHVGPALAVHSDTGGMDWFGSTVNLAARAQSAARDGALVVTDAVHDDPVVQTRLREAGLSPAPFEAELKGIGAQRLWRVPPDRQPSVGQPSASVS
jgi:class 3 adenylate cyclase